MFEQLSASQFKDIAQGVQAIVISLSVFVAGIWAVFTFLAQRYELLIRKQPLIRLELVVKQGRIPGNTEHYLSICVTAENAGNITNFLYYGEDDHLTVTPVFINSDGSRDFGDSIKRVLMRGDGHKVNYNTLLPNSKETLPFWVPVPGLGLYHIRFYVRPNKEQLRALTAVGHIGRNADIVISTNMYFVVEDETEA